jgi:hypothetical protein
LFITHITIYKVILFMKKGSKKNTKITRTKAKSTTSYKWLVFWIVLIILAALVGWKAYNSKTILNSKASTNTAQFNTVSGAINVTFIPVTFNSYPKHRNYDSGSESTAQIKEDILQLAPYIQEASEGKAQLTSASVQVVNRVTLNHTITLSDPNNPYSCMLDGGYWNNPWAQLAQEALLKAGISPSGNQRIIFIAPGLGCGPNSRADAWGQGSTGYIGAWMPGYTVSPEFYDGVNPIRFPITRNYLSPRSIIQALGFSLGLTWTATEDSADPMGNNYLNKQLVLFDGAHSDVLGWVSAANVKTFNLSSTDISQRIKRFGVSKVVTDPNTGLALPRLLKVVSNGVTFYIDYRAPNSYKDSSGNKKYGYDDGGGFLADTNSTQGVEILTFEGSRVRKHTLLKSSGSSFRDDGHNIQVTLQEFDDEYSSYWENEDQMVRIDISQITKTQPATPTPIPPTPTKTPTTSAYSVRQSYLTTTGDKYFQRTCPFDTSTGGPSTSCTTAWSTISLGSGTGQGFIGAPVTKAGAIVNFLFPQNGVTKIRQSFLTTSGNQQFHRTCSFDPNQSDINSYSSGKSSSCTAWSGPYNVTSVNGQTSYGGYAAITFKDSSGAYKVRQSYLTTTGDKYFQRTCPFDTSTGGPSSSCTTSWTTISLGSGTGQGYIGAPVANAGAIVNFLFPQNGATKIRQSFLTTAGNQQFHRTCSFDPNQSDLNSYSSGKSSNCTVWSGPYNVTSVNGQTSYGGYAAITFTK